MSDLIEERMEMEERQAEELRAKYRLSLTRGVGLDVLVDILHRCHFGSTLDFENPAMIAEYNVGVTILYQCGILGPGSLDDVVRALSAIEIPGPMVQLPQQEV